MKFIRPSKKIKKEADLSILAEAPRKKVADPDVEPAADGAEEQEHIPHFIPDKAAMKQTVKLFEHVFDNMHNKHQFGQFAGLILTGNPGGGKTSKVTLLAKVLGVELITIEAPHLIEEHIIHIPFLVRDPITDKDETGGTNVKFDKFKVVLGDSNLYSKIKNNTPVPDDKYLKAIYESSQDVIELFEEFGGTKDSIPQEIADIRKKFSVILFFDEYFRQTSTRIRNLLRGILNNRIGAHEIPPHAYCIYATNLEDAGIDEIPLNTQFGEVEVDSPTKKEWFSYLVFKFQKDKHVKLNPVIIDRFHYILKDEHMAYEDAAAEVRTSPRRWEQLLLYINASLPTTAKELEEFTEKDAVNLMSNVAVNFKNYLTGQHSQLAAHVLKAVARLIKDITGIEISHADVNKPSEWRQTLKHQIQAKQKLGDYRKYVPVLSGLPGVSKTTGAHQLATDMDLRFIDIDVSTINPEDVVGLPIANQTGEEKIETMFSLPSLYKFLMDKMKEKDKAYFELKKKELKDDAAFAAFKKEYETRPFKYLIFFDEMNRASTKVFNAIRQVLLEKHFGSANEGKGKKLELPKSAIMLAAINPHDIGAAELTSHMRDVLDIIEVGSDWKHTLGYLADQKVEGVSEQTHDICLDLVKQFGERWATTDKDVIPEERPFHLDLGQDVYISPREYTQLYLALCRGLNRAITKISKKIRDDLSSAEIKQLEQDLKDDVLDVMKVNSSIILKKQNKLTKEFYNDVKIFLNEDQFSFGENLFFKKAYDKKGASLADILASHLDGTATENAHENSQFVNFVSNVEINKFAEDFRSVLESRVSDKKGIDKYILEKEQDPKVLDTKSKQINSDSSEDKVSLVDNFLREIIYALYLHNFSFDKLEAAKKSLISTFKGVLSSVANLPDLPEGYEDEILGVATKVSLDIHMIIKRLPRDE